MGGEQQVHRLNSALPVRPRGPRPGYAAARCLNPRFSSALSTLRFHIAGDGGYVPRPGRPQWWHEQAPATRSRDAPARNPTRVRCPACCLASGPGGGDAPHHRIRGPARRGGAHRRRRRAPAEPRTGRHGGGPVLGLGCSGAGRQRCARTAGPAPRPCRARGPKRRRRQPLAAGRRDGGRPRGCASRGRPVAGGVPEPLAGPRSGRPRPRRDRRLRGRGRHHGRDLAGPGRGGPRRPRAPDRRGSLGRRPRTGSCRRGRSRSPLARPRRGQRQHRPGSAPRGAARGGRFFFPVVAGKPGAARGHRRRCGGRSARCGAAVLRDCPAGHRPRTGGAAHLRVGMRPGPHRAAGPAPGRGGLHPPGPRTSAGGCRACGPGETPDDRGTADATELGRLLDAGGRRGVQRFTDAVLDLDGDRYP